MKLTKLEGTARYAGLLLAPAEGFGKGTSFALQAKKSFLYCRGVQWYIGV